MLNLASSFADTGRDTYAYWMGRLQKARIQDERDDVLHSFHGATSTVDPKTGQATNPDFNRRMEQLLRTIKPTRTRCTVDLAFEQYLAEFFCQTTPLVRKVHGKRRKKPLSRKTAVAAAK